MQDAGVDAPPTARQFYRPLEALHVVGYFAPETTQAYLDAGLTDYGMGYFASRSAPMGAVPPEITVATFYVFAPALVGAYLPRAWELASPEQVMTARYAGIDAALRRGLGTLADSSEVGEAAELGRAAVAELTLAGRPLCAGHARLPWPTSPLLALWQAASVLREYRGDGHIAALTSAGFDPVEALVTAAAAGGPKKFLQSTRGWSPEQWAAGEERLRERGLLDADAALTDEGRRVRDWVETTTDAAAEAPYRRLGAEGAIRFLEVIRPLARALTDSGLLPASVTGKRRT
jgi:hypothetical protein